MGVAHYHGYLNSSYSTASVGRKTTVSQKLLLFFTLALSIGCLVWVLQDFEPEKLGGEIRHMHWGWVLAAGVFDILVYFLQGWRWSLLLRPVARVPAMRAIRAIYVGLFANEVLPLRTGELIRCYLMGRWSGLPFSVTFSSFIIERVFDGLWLVICLFASTYVAEVQPIYVHMGQVLLGLVILAGALLGAAMFFKTQTHAAFSGNKYLEKVAILLEDLYIMGHSRYLYFSAIASLPYLLLQVLPIYFLAQAYGIDLAVGQAFVVMVILRLVAVVPQAPGNLGTFQAAAVVALMTFGIDDGVAKRFSFVMWAIITLPLLVVGFIALAITGIGLSELTQKAKQAQ